MPQPPETESIEASYRFPGIRFIAQSLNRHTSRRVLDLGPASAASFNFFMHKGCTLRYENVTQGVGDQLLLAQIALDTPVEETQQSIRRFIESYLMSFRSHQKFDVVLAWDLFNYLDLASVEWLMSKLSAFCHDQSLLHSLRYSQGVPVRPGLFQILSDYQVKVQLPPKSSTKALSHSLPDLIRHLPFYHLDSSFTQQTGMAPGLSEDVLRYFPERKNRIRQTAKLDKPAVSKTALPGSPHRSYALATLCDHLSHIESPRILDLGAPIPSNLEFYRQFSDQITFANLYPRLLNGLSADDLAQAEDIFHCKPGEQFDVVMAWAILGYCSQEQLHALKKRLLPHIHNQTKIHVIIYAGHTQPSAPDQYFIKDSDTLHLPDVHAYCSTQPPLTAIRLLKLLGDASYEHSFILKPGMSPDFFEHILVLQKAPIGVPSL
jgi:hypothetical protein